MISDISLSNPFKMWSKPSTIVILEPSIRYAPPSSEPITPPPTIIKCLGTSGSDKAPVESIMRPPNGKEGISIGREPVEIITSLNCKSWNPSSCSTFIVLLSINSAVPWITSTLCFLSSILTPPVNWLTTLSCFHFWADSQFNLTFPTERPKGFSPFSSSKDSW